MFDPIVIWDLPDDPDGNVAHIALHGVTPDEVEDVLGNPANPTAVSRSSGFPITFGHTTTGRHLAVVWEEVDDDPRAVRPVTAYEVPEAGGPKGKKGRKR